MCDRGEVESGLWIEREREIVRERVMKGDCQYHVLQVITHGYVCHA